MDGTFLMFLLVESACIYILFLILLCHWCDWACSESDYAVLTRDFEEHVDDKVLEAVKNATAVAATAAASTVVAPTALAATAVW